MLSGEDMSTLAEYHAALHWSKEALCGNIARSTDVREGYHFTEGSQL